MTFDSNLYKDNRKSIIGWILAKFFFVCIYRPHLVCLWIKMELSMPAHL